MDLSKNQKNIFVKNNIESQRNTVIIMDTIKYNKLVKFLEGHRCVN